MKYLLDANAISHIVRFPTGKVAERLTEVGSEMVFTSIIVSAEVMFGVRKKGSDDLTRKVVAVLSKLAVAPFIQPADESYAEVRSRLEKGGRPIGPNDLFIAAHALALDATLVTDNEKEFSRVPGLKIENWLR
jgi:tRNA(fMet)-specific endonuclease VapC